MARQPVFGILALEVDGELYLAKGNFTYNPGTVKRESMFGADGKFHGRKETPQVPFIEGEVTDNGDLDITKLTLIENATVRLRLRNGKSVALSKAFYAGEGTVNTEEGNVPVRFEGQELKET